MTRNRLAIVLAAAVLLALALTWATRGRAPAERPQSAGIVPRSSPRPEPSPRAHPPAPAPAPAASEAPAAPASLSWEEIERELDAGRNVAWDQRSTAEWAEVAGSLHRRLQEVDALPPAEREARAGVVLDLLLELGRAAENANRPVSPGYGRVGGRVVDVGHYRAAQLVLDHPELGAPDEHPPLAHLARDLASGALPDVEPSAIERVEGDR